MNVATGEVKRKRPPRGQHLIVLVSLGIGLLLEKFPPQRISIVLPIVRSQLIWASNVAARVLHIERGEPSNYILEYLSYFSRRCRSNVGCYRRSLSAVLYMAFMGREAYFIIGMGMAPFVSHAWAETVNDEIVGNLSIPEGLSEVLRV